MGFVSALVQARSIHVNKNFDGELQISASV